MVSDGHGLAFASAMLVAFVAVTGPAAAGPNEDAGRKKSCVDAATQGQIQRDDGRLGAAAEAFATCADAACPAAVRRSCAEWLTDVRARRPSVTMEVPPERAASSVEVSVDGRPALAGSPLELDPGPHVVRVTAEGEPPFELPFVLAERERRTLRVERPLTPAAARVAPERPVPVPVWILGGVSVIGAAGFATFGLLAKSETDRLGEECAPVCTSEARASALRTAVAADVSLGVAVVAAAVAGVLYIFRPTRAPSSAPQVAGIAF